MKNLTEKQKKTLGLVVESGISENFYLAGGTAVALKYSHRHSEDFDFFSYEFSLRKIEKALRNLPDLEIEILKQDTVIFYLSGIKFSFFGNLTFKGKWELSENEEISNKDFCL